MLRITPTLALDEREIELDFVRASGPGGQNVNKVATAVQLRFDVRRSPSLPYDVRARLERLAGAQVTSDGVLVIDARHYRTQTHNRQAALARLADLVRQAATPPKPRHKTATPAAARERRLETKRQNAERKRRRQPARADE